MATPSVHCEHNEFTANVGVARFEDVGRFMAGIRISCVGCGMQFQFMGLPPGLNLEGATVSLDGLELTIGIHPQGLRPTPLQELMGHTVKSFN